MEIKEKLMKKKILTGFLFLVIFTALIYSAYFLFGDYYWSWKIGRDYQKFEQGYLDFLKGDTYGGKTPEETYVKFVDTLRAGNIDEAVKYFYWEKQGKEKERFLEMKEVGKLEEYVEKLPAWGEMREEDYGGENRKRFSYEVLYETEEKYYDPLLKKEITFPAGKGTASIDFYFNAQADVWKIYRF